MKLPHYFCIIGIRPMLCHFSMKIQRLISIKYLGDRLFGKVKRGIKKLGLTMNNVYNLFIQRRVYEKRI